MREFPADFSVAKRPVAMGLPALDLDKVGLAVSRQHLGSLMNYPGRRILVENSYKRYLLELIVISD